MNTFFQTCANGASAGKAVAEILLMLLAAGILGWLLRHFTDGLFGRKKEDHVDFVDDSVALDVDMSDLKVVEGIGPKIEELLKDAGIMTWADLADTDPEDIKAILTEAGNRFKMHDPTTWPEQAAMARDGQWDDLEEYQEFLNGGK